MNALAEALLIWRIEYQNELESCDKWIKWCEDQGDTRGMNFHQGKRSAAISTDISLHALKKVIEENCDSISGMAMEDLAKITHRASGDVNCKICGKRFKDHPMSPEPTYDGVPFLHKGCDGYLLKL